MTCATQTILVVEDEGALRQLITRVLRARGYNVLEAVDGQDALDRSASHGPIDLVVTDVVMPRLGGIELAQRLRAADPDLRVIYMSGFSESMVRMESSLLADARWINKPFPLNELVREVRAQLDWADASVA